MHLDSGIQRKETHRFYEREGMAITRRRPEIDVTAVLIAEWSFGT